MTPEALAAIHARCFDAMPRPWSAEEIRDLLALDTTHLVGGTAGFALGRVLRPEAELLTLAVLPQARRRGRGRALLAAFETEVRGLGASEVFLEVAETNAAARALYTSGGYVEAGFRRDYYTARGRKHVAALILRKVLAQ